MQAYLIDPDALTITPVEYSGDYTQIYRLIEADLFDVVTTPEGMSIYVDDEGLFNSTGFFAWHDLPVPLAGKALVLGPVDEDGYTTACPLSIDELWDKVFFGSPHALSRMIEKEGWADAYQ